MKAPTRCILWEHPEHVRAPLAEHFERLAIYNEESHFWRYLLRCRECGQRYFYEFYEEIDWMDGEDPQYVTFVPVDTDKDIERLYAATPLGLLAFCPRLQQDFPKEAKQPTVRWVKE